MKSGALPRTSLISPFSAAVIALVMHQSAYAAEIIRAGIQSVGTGQVEAARALGYRPSQIFRHTIFAAGDAGYSASCGE
ncbi:amino acid ABC transporter permease [Klebsiella michiganensis]|uniref:Amino acid ABC transporter permease n=1 Tax=Klebsiella michiganensis TaxID=1134687 RepID=A0A7H4PJN2_9ENTR|nr:amino acid ABC transporter permease [Klebsiella michiganensis]